LAAVADTLGGWMERAARRHDRGIHLLDRHERERVIPWPELVGQAGEVAGGLRSLGVGRGDRVGLVFPTGEAFLVAFFGVLRAGAAPVPLPPPSRLGSLHEQQRRLSAMLGATAPRLVLAEESLVALLREPLLAAPPALGCRALAELPPGEARGADVDDDALGLVQFSSGTTAAPKPVAL
jgi:acyl-CoA synthetase (AMP-forming)/AMP-acid ligase II